MASKGVLKASGAVVRTLGTGFATCVGCMYVCMYDDGVEGERVSFVCVGVYKWVLLHKVES